MTTVSLVKGVATNPVATNPKKKRRHRNPANVMSALQKPLSRDNLTLAASALIGAGIAAQVPSMLKMGEAKAPPVGWTNVFVTAAVTALGGAALHMAKAPEKITAGFVIGGTVMTVAKGLYVGTEGKFGLAPELTLMKSLDGVRGGIRHIGDLNLGYETMQPPQASLPAYEPRAALPPGGVNSDILSGDSYDLNVNEPLIS